MQKPNPPSHLSQESREWWAALTAENDISDAAGRLLLQTALESFDQMRRDQAVIASDGPTVMDRWGQTKPHPLLTSVRDARSQMLLALKQLNLDVEPPREKVGRPPGTLG